MVLAPSQSPREWRAPPSGLDRVQQRGWGSGLYSRRSAQGWQLWTIPLKAGLIAGTDLGTAGHGDHRLPPPLRPGTSRQRTPRLERRHQSPGIPMALPVKPSPGWEANDALDSETGDLASLVGETTASEASTWPGIRHRLQRQQPPARQSRLLVQHPRRHILLRPVEDTSRAQPPCRRQLTAAFYCNRRPKRLLLERGCTDGTGPRPSIEP